jgi:hypothetical protein
MRDGQAEPVDLGTAAPGPRSSLHYVADMLGQLRVVVGRQGSPFLTYLLEMARAEAVRLLQAPERQADSETRPSE